MKTRTVKHTVDLSKLPVLTAKQRAELMALSQLPDQAIDKSDIPKLTDRFWKSAVRNPFYKATKQSTTVRLDSDVLQWLKADGKGYQTRLNSILRDAMLRELVH